MTTLKCDRDNQLYAMPHPYPVPERAVGISVSGGGELLPEGCWVQALQSDEDGAQYEFMVCAKVPSLSQAMDLSALARINIVLTTMGLPTLKNMVGDSNGIYQELADTVMLPDEECVIHYLTSREAFESMYRCVATSDYVQLSHEADVGYVIDESDEKVQERLYRLYQRMFQKEEPIVAKVTRRSERSGEVSGASESGRPKIFPIIDRELELVGVMTQHPTRIISIQEADGIARCTAKEEA